VIFINEHITYGALKARRKLFARIYPEACAVNFEEIDKRLGEG